MAKENKAKKPFYKKWWVWVIAIILIAAIANPSEESSNEDTKQPASEASTPKAEVKEEPKVEVKKEPETPKVDPDISKDEFDQIQNGMTYEEVVAIIGGNGEVMSEVGEKGTPYYSIMYMYKGEKGLGSNANFTFQDNKLQAKAQFGLK